MFNLKHFGPISAITNNLIAARFWFVIAILGWTTAALSPYFTVLAMKQRDKAIILTPAGDLLYSPIKSFNESQELHAYAVRLASLALFQRNPNGADMPDLIDRIFYGPAKKKAFSMLDKSQTDFSAKEIHQKVEVNEIRTVKTQALNKDVETYLVAVKGNLTRRGVVNGLPFDDPQTFTMQILLVRNSNLLQSGKLPLVVYDFDYSEDL